jgi:hypothetical protein
MAVDRWPLAEGSDGQKKKAVGVWPLLRPGTNGLSFGQQPTAFLFGQRPTINGHRNIDHYPQTIAVILLTETRSSSTTHGTADLP